MIYERMKYASDQRAWVKYVDEKLPGMELHAARLQREAQEQWNVLQSMPMHYKAMGFTQRLVSECYKEAHSKLLQCIYYKAMREANR